QRLNTQTKTIPNLLCSAASASKARTAATRSPYAAGRAKAAGRSGETTPGTKNAKPTNLKLCKRRSGRKARTRGWMSSAGQRDRNVVIPQARKLRAILVPNKACGGIMDSLPNARSCGRTTPLSCGWLGPFWRVHLRDDTRGGRRWDPRPSEGARPSSWSGWPSHRLLEGDHSQALVQEVLQLALERRADLGRLGDAKGAEERRGAVVAHDRLVGLGR